MDIRGELGAALINHDIHIAVKIITD